MAWHLTIGGRRLAFRVADPPAARAGRGGGAAVAIARIHVARAVLDETGRGYLDAGQLVAGLDGALDDAIGALAADGLRAVRRLPIGGRRRHVFLARPVRTRCAAETLDAVQALQASGRYRYIEPDLVERLDSRWRPDDAGYPLQWQWANDGGRGGVAGADVGAERAWDRTRGAGVRIAVVDKGCELAHPALAGATAWGGHFTGGTTAPRFALDTGPAFPRSRHGTACAGMAIARAGRGGGCGIAPEAALVPIACATADLGAQSELAEALIYAALPGRAGGDPALGADVISCSLGPNGAHWPLTAVLSDAIDTVTTEGRGGRGALVVWAASNAHAAIEHDRVVSDPRILAVARSTRRDRHDHAAFGPGLDLVAPGVDVYTASTGARRWSFATACSLAAPVVAGIAGLVLARDPSLTRRELADRLRATCRKVRGDDDAPYDAAGWSPRYGHGRVDAGAAVP
jgi:thermitase